MAERLTVSLSYKLTYMKILTKSSVHLKTTFTQETITWASPRKPRTEGHHSLGKGSEWGACSRVAPKA